MLIHQGWFTALYTEHLLDSQSFEFEICILQALNMPLIRCTNVFSKGGYPVKLLPPPRRLVPSLGLGTTWVRQLQSGSCHYPTAATKCNEPPSRVTETPSVEKYAHPPRVVYCAIFTIFALSAGYLLTKINIGKTGNQKPPSGGFWLPVFPVLSF